MRLLANIIIFFLVAIPIVLWIHAILSPYFEWTNSSIIGMVVFTLSSWYFAVVVYNEEYETF